MDIKKALKTIERFKGPSLKNSIANIESEIIGFDRADSERHGEKNWIDDNLLNSALAVKKASSQIDVIIHATGILRSLRGILEPDEKIESVSLGAGNTGKKFDLETNHRVAEFKFIDWQGGSESIRQNGLFKDFLELAEHQTKKRKYLYVIGTELPLKFLRGGRKLTSVLSRDSKKLLPMINEKYGPEVVRVRDYYNLTKDRVEILDISALIGRTL